MSRNNGYTPTEKRIMDVLQDWQPHPKQELCKAVDEYADNNALQAHLCSLRIKLEPRAINIMESRRYGTYQLVSMNPPDEE